MAKNCTGLMFLGTGVRNNTGYVDPLGYSKGAGTNRQGIYPTANL